MKEEILFSLSSPYRQTMKVKGWYFGNRDKKTVAIMGALRGNEIQQMYICSLLIQTLKELEEKGQLSKDCGILVVPCANQLSMNVGKRFFASDNTDINRMVPGYELGETTQRIAGRLFKVLSGYELGVHLVSLYLPGDIIPHVRIMKSGYEQPEEAKAFGLPYVILRDPAPFDTTTLNYNWQVWETRAYSVYARETDQIDVLAANQCLDAILRFLYFKGISTERGIPQEGASTIFPEEQMDRVLSTAGGLLIREVAAGDQVKAGDLLGRICNPCDGTLLQTMTAPRDGCVFFTHHPNLINGHEVAYMIVPD